MKKIIIASVTGLVLLGLYVAFSSSETKSNNIALKAENIEKEIVLEEELPLLTELEEKDEENLTLINVALEIEEHTLAEELIDEVEPEMVEDAKDIMVETDMSEVEAEFPSKEGIAPSSAIALVQGTISKLNVGDTISLPYMGNGEFNAKISNKKVHKNGAVTVTGNLVDSGKDYSVVLTEGKTMSFGTVTTPNGSYEIETRNGQGYVYSTDDIDREWIDHSQSDTLVPTGV